MGTLDEIEARADTATKGPWKAWGRSLDTVISAPGHRSVARLGDPLDSEAWHNAEFVANAREDVPRLIGAVKWLADQLHERSGGDPEAWAAEALGGDA